MTCRWALAALTAVALVVLLPSMAAAQSEAPVSLRAGHVTIAGGFNWTGGYSIGDRLAELRTNAMGSNPPPFTLFRADSSIDDAIGGDVRVGYSLTRSIAIEGGVNIARPGITVRLSEDEEAATTTLDAEQLSQFVVDAGVVWQLAPSFGRRMRPFLTGGGGYLRQLYDERTVVETGSVVYAGGGVRYWLRGGDGVRRSLGLRADARAQWRTGGVDFEDKTRMTPQATVLVFWEM